MGQGAYIFGCDGLRLTPDEKSFFARSQPWGFILFARNIETPDQLRGLCKDLRDSVGRDAPIMIDQEGGRVQRMQRPHWRQWHPPMDQIKQAGDAALRSLWLRYRLIAAEMREVGIDCNCAPIADVTTDVTHPFLRNRCYGDNPDQVGRYARAVADGLLDGGVLPIVKHMPGHGRAGGDSHMDLPIVDATLAQLQDQDFKPFAALADLPMAMTAHIVYSALDGHPATQSRKMVTVMRDDIGFGGILMTDDISMQALKGSVTDQARLALDAGCDLVLHCNGDLPERRAVADICGDMSVAATVRGQAALAARRPASDVDVAALETELAGLLDGPVYV